MEEIPFDFLGTPPAPHRGMAELMARRRAEQKRNWQKGKGKESHRASERKYRWNSRAETNFVGVDGEGNQSDYLLLRAGDDVLHTGRNLRLEECLEFLTNLPTKGVEYVAFFFDYDVTMMLRELPAERLLRLLDRDKRTITTSKGKKMLLALDVCGDRFQVDYLPGKEFKARRRLPGKNNFGPYITISDVGSFFQCSFVKALTAWNIGAAGELDEIIAGKADRAYFETMTEEVQHYNWLECQLLSRLMAKFAAACRGMGYLPRKWQGPGQLAEAMLRTHGIPTREQIENGLPLDLQSSANKAYYGGRFEITRVGFLDSPTYAYDINSAYPDAIRNLPCLEHGQWRIENRRPSDGSLALCYGTFRPRKGWEDTCYLWALPFRTEDGHIIYPGSGKGWYWSTEIDEAKHQTFRTTLSWIYERNCDCKPFDFIGDLYKLRKQWQSESADSSASNMGIALKLALNSLYGKMAQSIGAAPFANSVYASLITANVRAKLMAMVHNISECKQPAKGCGRDVFYLATDGIFSGKPASDLSEIGKALGQWDYERIDEDILLVQPGVYISANIKPDSDDSWVKSRVKTRGIPKAKIKQYSDEFRKAFERIILPNPDVPGSVPLCLMFGSWVNLPTTTVTIPFHQFIGLRQAKQLGDFSMAGQWIDIPKRYSFGYKPKRSGKFGIVGKKYIQTRAPIGDTVHETKGYTKEIGRWLEENKEWYAMAVWNDEQPEESDVFDLLREI